jgi:hypothetical protein
MHQTTVRFGADLWAALEAECGRLGVSAAQYLRESALARLAYTAGRRGELEYDEALIAAGAPSTDPEWLSQRDAAALLAAAARIDASEHTLDARAVLGQNELAKRRAQLVRARSRELRKTHDELVARQRR